MFTVRKPLQAVALASLLATMGLVATAQTNTPAAAPTATATDKAGQHGKRFDPAKMQERVAKRQAAMKEKLKITAAQEPAWSTFTTAMKPVPRTGARPDRAAFEKLTTPQRIDKMRELRTQRIARMDQRADATKTFYAALSPDQKKVFDESTLRKGKGHGHGHGHGKGGHHGGWHHKG